MNPEKEVKWLNSKDQIDNASEEELRRVLLTCDGNGVEFKKLALDKLISLATQNFCMASEDVCGLFVKKKS